LGGDWKSAKGTSSKFWLFRIFKSVAYASILPINSSIYVFGGRGDTGVAWEYQYPIQRIDTVEGILQNVEFIGDYEQHIYNPVLYQVQVDFECVNKN